MKGALIFVSMISLLPIYADDHCEQSLSFSKKVAVKRKKSFYSKKSNRKPSSIRDLYQYAGTEGCDDMTRAEIDSASDIIKRLNGTIVSPYDYSESESGLDDYLRDTGVSMNYFSASEMITPNNFAAAKACKYTTLLPKRCRWISAAVQGMIASEMRLLVGSPIKIRNWWRPSCYNSKVGGASGSDHKQARGFDLDFIDRKGEGLPEARAKAQEWLCSFYKEKAFNLQTGIGAITLHIGVGSPRGSRYWTYGSLNSGVIKRTGSDNCWNLKNGSKSIYVRGGTLNL